MIYYGIASRAIHEVIEFYATREEADVVLQKLLEEAPALTGDMFVTTVEFPTPSRN